LDAELVATGSEAARAEAGALVALHAANVDAHAGEISHRLAQKFAGQNAISVWQHGGETDAGVIVDGEIEELPIGAARFVLRIADEALAGLMNAANFLMSMYYRLPGAVNS
jgi:hypothetical protein